MKKKKVFFLFLLTAALLAGCRDEVTPDERLKEYVSMWSDQDYGKMYEEYISAGSKDTFNQEAMEGRTVKLYEDMEVKNLDITVQDVPEDTEWSKKEPAEIPINVSFETLAGPVSFEKEVKLVYEEQEEENWFIEWDPSFILSGLEPEDTVRIESEHGVRGEILDRNGKPLAVNGTGYQVGVVPGELTEEAKQELADQISLPVEKIEDELSQSWVEEDLFVPLKKMASNRKETVTELTELPGIYSQSIDMREYPYGEAAAHLTGYIGSITAEQLEEEKGEGYTSTDLVGKRGLEELLEDRLRSKTGTHIFIEKSTDKSVTVAESEAQDGETITLTIDADLQKNTYEAMKGEQGTSAAVDPMTGETLVLTSSPGFDPAEFSLGVSGERYAEMENQPDQPLLNRFAVTYAPGSAQKTLTAAIGLEAGTLDPEESFTINGLEWQKEGWGDFKVTRVHEGPNPINLNKGLVYSDNIYFAQIALNMGADTLVEGLKKLGYSEDIPFSYPLRTSQISNDGTIGSEGQLADTSYGQGEMLTNILHLASMYEIVVNDGVMMKPLLFEGEEEEVWKENLLSSEQASLLRKDLREVVTVGFAKPADIPEVSIAGKTGTAELKQAGEESGKENGFFVAYNEKDPAYILAMMIEGVEEKGGSTYVSELAAEVFKKDAE